MSIDVRHLMYNNEQDQEQLIFDAIISKYKGTGSTPDISYKIVFGDSGVISAGSREQIWPLGTTSMDFPASAEVLDIVSSSVNDDAGGSGLDAVFIEGLDGDLNPISELVLLDGTTTVNSTNSYRHVSEVNCLRVAGATGETNAGNITITQTTSGDTLAYILAGDSLSKHSQFIIPNGYNAIFLGGHISVYRSSGSGERRASIELDILPVGSTAGANIMYKTLKYGGSSGAGANTVGFRVPLVIQDKTALIPIATAEANNTRVSVDYAILLIKNTLDLDSIF